MGRRSSWGGETAAAGNGYLASSVTLSLCTAFHLLYARSTKRFGASLSETTLRPGPRNGLACAAGGVLRLFGKALAFDGGRCAPYEPYVHDAAPALPTKPIQLRLKVIPRELARNMRLGPEV